MVLEALAAVGAAQDDAGEDGEDAPPDGGKRLATGGGHCTCPVATKSRDLTRDVAETTTSAVRQTAVEPVAEQVAGLMLRLASATPAVKNDISGFPGPFFQLAGTPILPD